MQVLDLHSHLRVAQADLQKGYSNYKIRVTQSYCCYHWAFTCCLPSPTVVTFECSPIGYPVLLLWPLSAHLLATQSYCCDLWVLTYWLPSPTVVTFECSPIGYPVLLLWPLSAHLLATQSYCCDLWVLTYCLPSPTVVTFECSPIVYPVLLLWPLSVHLMSSNGGEYLLSRQPEKPPTLFFNI